MIQFERRYTLKMVGKALQIGDTTSGKFGDRILVTDIISVEVESGYLIIKGYGYALEY